MGLVLWCTYQGGETGIKALLFRLEISPCPAAETENAELTTQDVCAEVVLRGPVRPVSVWRPKHPHRSPCCLAPALRWMASCPCCLASSLCWMACCSCRMASSLCWMASSPRLMLRVFNGWNYYVKNSDQNVCLV